MMRKVGVSAWTTTAVARGRIRTSLNRPILHLFPYPAKPMQVGAGFSTTGVHNAEHFQPQQRQKICLVKTQTTRLFSSSTSSSTSATTDTTADFANQVFDTNATFASIGVTNPILLQRIAKLGFQHPTKVQAECFSKIKRQESRSNEDAGPDNEDGMDLRPKPSNIILGSETGSGKVRLLGTKTSASEKNIHPLTLDNNNNRLWHTSCHSWMIF